MMEWIRFFLGTPRRFLTTLVGLGLIATALKPDILYGAVNALLVSLSPLMGYALTILIVLAGIRMILPGKKS